jgi:hypothetical protein
MQKEEASSFGIGPKMLTIGDDEHPPFTPLESPAAFSGDESNFLTGVRRGLLLHLSYGKYGREHLLKGSLPLKPRHDPIPSCLKHIPLPFSYGEP